MEKSGDRPWDLRQKKDRPQSTPTTPVNGIRTTILSSQHLVPVGQLRLSERTMDTFIIIFIYFIITEKDTETLQKITHQYFYPVPSLSNPRCLRQGIAPSPWGSEAASSTSVALNPRTRDWRWICHKTSADGIRSSAYEETVVKFRWLHLLC